MKIEIGAQLYTVRDYTQTVAGFDRTLKAISGIGYKYLQISAVGNIGYQNIKDTADKYGMRIIVTHTDQRRILEDTDYVIAEHKLMNCDNIGIGIMPSSYSRDKEGVLRFVNDYLPVAKKIKAAGMKLIYHNHDFEFDKSSGKMLFEYMLEGFAPDELYIMPDIFWMQAGGVDPAQWIEDLRGRMELVHFKDYTIVNGQRRMAEVMCGNLNWKRIVEACYNNGIKYAFVEQDDCYGRDQFECLKTSYENYRRYEDENSSLWNSGLGEYGERSRG